MLSLLLTSHRFRAPTENPMNGISNTGVYLSPHKCTPPLLPKELGGFITCTEFSWDKPSS